MTGPGAGGPGPLPLEEIDELIGRTGDISLTIEDVVLLVLGAGDRPVEGLGRLTGEVMLALKEVLDGPDVEAAVFERGPGGPRSEDVDLALDGLAFSNSVKVAGDGKDPSALKFEIAPRGRARIREKWDALPAGARRALSQKRAEWDAAEPAAMKEPLYVHNEALLKGVPQAVPPGGQSGQPDPNKPPAGGAADAAKRQGYVDRGDRLYSEDRYDEAHAAYKMAARYGAPDAALHFRMARSLAGMELYGDALEHCRAVIRADPADASGYIAMGHCLNRLGRHAEALPYSRRAVLRGPRIPQAYMVHGSVLAKLGRHAEALPHYQRAVRLDPSNVEARQHAFDSLARQGRYKEALPHAEQLARMSPPDLTAHARIATCLSQMGRHEEAIPAGRRAIEAAPDRVDSHFPLIVSLFSLGRHEEVLKWCGRAAEANAMDPQPHFVMAMSLRALGRFDKALAHCRRAADLGARGTDLPTFMSYLLRDLGRFDEALPHCEAVVSAKPGDPHALSNMGGVLADLGRHKDALACFDRALQIDPKQPAPHYNRALSLQATRRPRKALRQYRKVVALDPGNTGAYNNMGTVLAKLGRDSEALAHFDRALEIDPGNAAAHHNKALSLLRLSLNREALAHFDRALELSPGNPDAYVGRISCLDELKLPDKPIGHYAGEDIGPAAAQGGGATLSAAAQPAAGVLAATAASALATAVAEAVVKRAVGRRAPALETARGEGRVQLVGSLLSKNESKVLEFKSWIALHQEGGSGQRKMAEKVARELCSLVNTEGGDLLIGVGDGGEVEGLAHGGGRLSRKEKDVILTWLADVINAYFGAEYDGYFDYDVVEVECTDILHCSVAASKDGPVTLKRPVEGKHEFFVRVGGTCRPYGPREMLRYISKKWPELAPRPQPMGHTVDEKKGEIGSVVKSKNMDLPTGVTAWRLGGEGHPPCSTR